MTENLFVYGTLKEPKIQQELLGRILIGQNDTIENYELSSIKIENHNYPLLKEAIGKSVTGKVFTINKEDFKALDFYETDAYTRLEKKLKSGKIAWVYLENKN